MEICEKKKNENSAENGNLRKNEIVKKTEICEKNENSAENGNLRKNQNSEKNGNFRKKIYQELLGELYLHIQLRPSGAFRVETHLTFILRTLHTSPSI